MTAPVKRYTVELYPGAPELHEVVLASEYDALHQQAEAQRADRDSWCEQAEQRLDDWDQMRQERDALHGHLHNLLTGDVGKMMFDKLRTGQATDTADGKAWIAAKAAMASKEGV